MTVPKSNIERKPARKTSLFCPGCSRSAPAGDGWSLDDHDDRTEVSCPDCGSTVISQPRFDPERRSPPITA
jgi:DNA-directed RNA polymerase subunit RPC12/RpoP